MPYETTGYGRSAGLEQYLGMTCGLISRGGLIWHPYDDKYHTIPHGLGPYGTLGGYGALTCGLMCRGGRIGCPYDDQYPMIPQGTGRLGYWSGTWVRPAGEYTEVVVGRPYDDKYHMRPHGTGAVWYLGGGTGPQHAGQYDDQTVAMAKKQPVGPIRALNRTPNRTPLR